MLAILAQNTPVGDADILDDYNIPFGNWVEEAVNWANVRLDPLFGAIKWPFDALLDVVVDGFFIGAPWYLIVLFIMVVGTLTRNLKIGVLSGLAIGFCGLLGNDFWQPTVETVGMISVAVFLCAVIGIPLGILCGRMDGVWNAVRPVLDGMQVVHPFVYLLPVIFFFGIGRAPGVMATMVFALPPIVRLTNLGIRQVPEDVVEAARSYGAPESRVLRDVQIPLARTAIMTGLNQTLLMAVSMVGVVALIAGGGLGQMVFRGVQNLNTPLAASAGLALYIVAVVMDRITQPEGTEGGMAARLFRGWQDRKNPERILEAQLAVGANPLPTDDEARDSTAPSPEPVGSRERFGAALALAASVVALVSTALPWANDGAPISSYPRGDDGSIEGAISGLSATGGSWFAILVLLAAAVLIVASVALLTGRDVPRALGPELSMAMGAVLFVLPLSYLVLSPSAFATDYSIGFGAIVATLAGLAAMAGALIRLLRSPYRPRRVPQSGIRWSQIVAMIAAAGLVVGGATGSWIFDERTNVVTPEIAQQVAELEELAKTQTPGEQAATAVSISSLLRGDGEDSKFIALGFDELGPQLALPFLIVGLLAAGLGVVGSLDVVDNRWRWFVNALSFSFALAAMSIPLAWTISIVRVAPQRYYTGAGNLAALVGTAIIASAVAARFGNYHRHVVWGAIETEDGHAIDLSTVADDADIPVAPGLVTAR